MAKHRQHSGDAPKEGKKVAKPCTPKKGTTNLSKSISQRLLNQSSGEEQLYGKLLVDYVINRFLYRLSQSAYSDQFVLKGGLMLKTWCGIDTRPTRDIDFQGRNANGDAKAIVEQIREILSMPLEDGVVFPPDLCKPIPQPRWADITIIQMKCWGMIGNIKVPFQIDVAIGDTSYAGASVEELPTYLDFPAPKLLCCSRENLIAEKYHAMVRHGDLNSHMKDFYDIWLLSQKFEFDSIGLVRAIRNVFFDRKTSLPTGSLEAFGQRFIEDHQAYWTGFIAKSAIVGAPASFKDVTDAVDGFLAPLVPFLSQDDPESLHWDCSGLWKKAHGSSTNE
jgi:predicted nucleotidyltransferase component of viral defense system